MSTQDLLRGSGLPEGAVAVTEHQTAGRGRAGRAWVDEPGVVAARLGAPAPRRAGRPAAASCRSWPGLAVAEAIEAAAGITVPGEVAQRRRARRRQARRDPARDRRRRARVRHRGERRSGCGAPAAARPASRRARCGSATGRTHDRASLLVGLLAHLEARYDEWLAGGLAAALEALARARLGRGRTVRTAGRDGCRGRDRRRRAPASARRTTTSCS